MGANQFSSISHGRPDCLGQYQSPNIIQELRDYLGHDDARALRLCREHGPLLASVFGVRGDLVKAVERFAFVEALALLDAPQGNSSKISTAEQTQNKELQQ
jgi:hypothetical protein